MSKSKEYKAIKNYIHNDLKLTKVKLQEIITEAVKDEAKSQVKQYIQQQPDFKKLVTEQLFKEVANAVTGRTYDRARDEFFKTVGIELVKSLELTLKK